jgi:hypothetical protein
MEIYLYGIYLHKNHKKCNNLFTYFSKSAHLNGITQIIYKTIIINNKPQNIILSLGKDGFFKIWNADSLLCMTAISTNTTEAFSMVYN